MSEIDDSKAPLLDHLIELRQRLVRSILALAVAFGVCFYFAKDIFRFLAQPLVNVAGSGNRLIYTKLYEAFFTELKVAMFAAFFVAFPIIANQVWAFIAPGLYRQEKRAFLPFLIATPVLFTMGAALAYYVVMPIAFKFLLGYQVSSGDLKIDALPSIAEYLSTVMQFIFAFGVAFLLPILLMLLERAGIVSLAQLKAGRRYAIVAAFVIAAVLTPPDVISQLLLAVPLVLLYEIALVGIRLTHRKRGTALTPTQETL